MQDRARLCRARRDKVGDSMAGKEFHRCRVCGKKLEGIKICPECERKLNNDYQRDNYDKFKEKDSPLRTARWRKLRAQIIRRDGGFCQRCWHKYGILTTECLTVDHIKSRKDYPELMWDENNLVTLCKTCNSQKGDRNELDFEWTPPRSVVQTRF